MANMSLADGLEMVDDEAGREEPEYRRLSHVEQLQLAYVRFRPIMASVVLARLLLTVGVLCLNERDLKNVCFCVILVGKTMTSLSVVNMLNLLVFCM